MNNKVNVFKESRRGIEIVRGLLNRMDADIVAFDGSLPDVTVEEVGRLVSGGKIYLSVPDSESCFLKTDSEDVCYDPDTRFGGPHIFFRDWIKNPSKHAMKDKSYNFYIELAGQRGISR